MANNFEDINPLEFYKPFTNIIGRDVYDKRDDSRNFEDKKNNKRKHGKQFKKETEVLQNRRYTRLTENVDAILVKLAEEQGIEVAALLRNIVVEYLVKNRYIEN